MSLWMSILDMWEGATILKQLLKRTKTFIEADFIITMMSWSYILMSRFFSCKITTCIRQRFTEDRINSRPQMLSS